MIDLFDPNVHHVSINKSCDFCKPWHTIWKKLLQKPCEAVRIDIYLHHDGYQSASSIQTFKSNNCSAL